MITNKKYRYAAIVLGVLAVAAFGVVGFSHNSPKAEAADWTVPQFGANVGDYSSCFNGYVEDDGAPGNSVSGNWTPVGGGIQNGVSGISSFQSGDCIQAGMATDTNNEYTQDFRIGIRVSAYGHNIATRSSSGSSVGANCDNWSTWQYTPWASTGGGTSALAASPVPDSWGLECVQLRVDTQPLPAGVAFIRNPNFGITISHAGNPSGDTTALTESYTTAACYLDRPWPGVDPNPPAPSCQMSPAITGGNFYSASISLTASSMGAVETANNIPTTFNPSETKTTGNGGGPLSITFENTGGIPWTSTFISKDISGTQSGTCNYDYNRDGVNDAPAPGSPANSSCSVSSVITSSNYALVHSASSFAVSPETVPISYKVTKTTTYTPPSTSTQTANCYQNGPSPSDQACPLPNGSSCQGGTCYVTQPISQVWTVSYSGGGYSPSIGNGNTVAFPLSSITATSTPGTYNQTWQMALNGAPFGQAFTLPITVGSPAAGTVTVTSQNSQTNTVGRVLVPAAGWDVLGGATDVCTEPGAICSGTSATYSNQPANVIYAITNATLPTAYIGAYRFDKVQASPIVKNNSKNEGIAGLLSAFSKSFFVPTAEASTCSAAPNCYSSIPGYPVQQQFLVPNTTVAFTILWNPVANMSLSQYTWSPAAASGAGAVTQPITITNTGAPGSNLTWSASSSAGWLTATPNSDNVPGLTNGVSGNASEVVTITANPSGLSVGTYTGIITLSARSTIDYNSLPSQAITVTFNVTSASGNNPTSVSVSCNPSTTYTNGASTCAATVSGSGSYSSGVTWSANTGTIDSTGHYVAPGTAGTATITACSSQSGYTNVCGSAPITITTPPPPTCPVGDTSCQAACTLTASPTSIVVPESSNLQYTCTNVTQCQLSGGGLNATNPGTPLASQGTISGSATTTPSVTTTYTVSCVNSSYSSDSVTTTVQVTVGGSGRCETNPNGAGCPGQ